MQPSLHPHTSDAVHGHGREVAGRAPSARSNAYVNGHATRDALRRLAPRAERRNAHRADELPIGAHLLTPRRGYTHHGIYVGNGRVVHYAGLYRALTRGPVEEVSLEEFADGQAVHVKVGAKALYPGATIVERARSRLGEDRYSITTNNCEHFCEWCLRGESRSEQIERLLAWPRNLLIGLFAWIQQSLQPFRPRVRVAIAVVPAKELSSIR
jgi:hypothetical protein